MVGGFWRKLIARLLNGYNIETIYTGNIMYFKTTTEISIFFNRNNLIFVTPRSWDYNFYMPYFDSHFYT